MIIIVNVPTPSMIRGMRVGRSWVRIPPESRGISSLALTAPSQNWECYGSSGKTQASFTHPNFLDLDIINTGTVQGGSMDLVNTGTIQGGSKRGLTQQSQTCIAVIVSCQSHHHRHWIIRHLSFRALVWWSHWFLRVWVACRMVCVCV